MLLQEAKKMLKELIVDNFAGGGGASTGIEMAVGRSVDIAINHDPAAIAMHKVNHPGTKHYCEDVWEVSPVEACNGRPVALAWFSPDCTHFSRAKGGTPVDHNIRGLELSCLKTYRKSARGALSCQRSIRIPDARINTTMNTK